MKKIFMFAGPFKQTRVGRGTHGLSFDTFSRKKCILKFETRKLGWNKEFLKEFSTLEVAVCTPHISRPLLTN
jgi:hypothetical protein